MAQVDIAKLPLPITFSRNPVLFRFKVLPYDSEDIAINTRVVATLYAESQHYRGDFQELKTVTLRPDADGFCEQDWSSLLDAQLEFYVPRPRQTTPQIAKKQAIRYYIRFYLSNDYETMADPATTTYFHVIKGGLAYPAMDISTFFSEKTSLGNDQTFLRFDYDREYIHKNDPLWLYAITPLDISGDIGIAMNVVYVSDAPGISHLVTQVVSITAFQFQIICFPVGIGPNWLNLTNWDKILSIDYKATHFATNTILGKKQNGSFLIDQYNRYDEKVINYHNSLGGFDTIGLKGEVEFSSEKTSQDVKLINVPKYAQDGLVEAIDRQANSLERVLFKGETGFIPKHRIDRLRDLLNSNLAYEYRSAIKKMIPIRVRTTKSALWKRTDQLYNLALDWDEAWTDKNYTPEAFIGLPANACPSVEYFNVSQAKGQHARIHWQLAEGYDTIEVQVADISTSSPPNSPQHTFILTGNKGQADIDVHTFTYTIGPQPLVNLRFWVRTVCDLFSSPPSTSAWSAFKNATIYFYAPSIPRNDFATTYVGAGPRILTLQSGSSVLNNDSPQNGGFMRVVSTTTITGSQGGTVIMPYSGEPTYTPPSGTFEGIEVFDIVVVEQISISSMNFGPNVQSKLYVMVQKNVGTTIQNTGNVFVKLVLSNFATSYIKETFSGNTYTSEVTTAKLSLYFFKNPAGTVAYDVTNLGLTADVAMQITANGTVIAPGPTYPLYFPSVGTYPNNSPLPGGPFPLTGTSVDLGTVLTRYDKYQAPDVREFVYTIVQSPNFFII